MKSIRKFGCLEAAFFFCIRFNLNVLYDDGQKGAYTFRKAGDPKNDFLSPYKFFPVNIYSYAWSCSPVYFIRKYFGIFQK